MPFTPFHMGPGILIKGVLRGSFSLMIFGWSQVVMDVQPLVAILTGQGELHGFTHTYVGSTLIAIFSAVTGKYLSEWALAVVAADRAINIGWRVAFVTAFIGAYSHVILDSIMHADMTPLFPFSSSNQLLGVFSIDALHKLCIYSTPTGAFIYFVGSYLLARRNRAGSTVRD